MSEYNRLGLARSLAREYAARLLITEADEPIDEQEMGADPLNEQEQEAFRAELRRLGTRLLGPGDDPS